MHLLVADGASMAGGWNGWVGGWVNGRWAVGWEQGRGGCLAEFIELGVELGSPVLEHFLQVEPALGLFVQQ